MTEGKSIASYFNYNEELARLDFMRTAESFLGTPYIWGGDDPMGFDCSGLVIEALKAAGKLKENADMTADGLFHRYYPIFKTDKPRAGTLVFAFNPTGKAIHVGVCRSPISYIGAEGGGSHVKTVQDAMAWNAFIKIRPLSKLKERNPKFAHIWEE